MKRTRQHSCFLCEKNGASDCNGLQPCNVCIRNSHPQMCYGGSTHESVIKEGTHLLPKSKSGPAQSIETTTITSDNNQPFLNQYIMNELKQMRDGYALISEQMNALQIENEQLSSVVEQLESRTKDLASIPREPTLEDFPTVIYDLTHQPPIVQTANEIFCKMLGYELHEVVGKPWQNFIKPDFVKRTGEALSNNHRIQIRQCYEHKADGYFFTKDSYQIFTDENKNPISVIATIRPERVVHTNTDGSPSYAVATGSPIPVSHSGSPSLLSGNSPFLSTPTLPSSLGDDALTKFFSLEGNEDNWLSTEISEIPDSESHLSGDWFYE